MNKPSIYNQSSLLPVDTIQETGLETQSSMGKFGQKGKDANRTLWRTSDLQQKLQLKSQLSNPANNSQFVTSALAKDKARADALLMSIINVPSSSSPNTVRYGKDYLI